MGDAVRGPRDLSTALLHWGRFWIVFEPRDIWVGVFVARKAVYVCPVPCLVVKWERKR